MLFEILIGLTGFGAGVYYAKNLSASVSESQQRASAYEKENSRLKNEVEKVNERARYRIAEFEREIVQLKRINANFLQTARREAEERDRNRLRYAENDISDVKNQIRFISSVELYASRPVNKEASKVLYALDDWVKNKQPKWRMAFEVGMGSFIKTKNHHDEQAKRSAFSSYNSKRVDFLLVDERGFPKLAVEYHGSGHDLSDDAADRMKVKRLALSRVRIPLVEVPEGADKSTIQRMASEALTQHAAD